ncbi:MAG: hypothetical protein HYZ42_06520 [Bacteroidetes bacterium]|nr:hypothetical protein [Bacteroidota bacterium]
MKIKNLISALVIVWCSFSQVSGQTDTIDGEPVERIEIYDVTGSTLTVNGVTTYEVNGKEVKKSYYDKFFKTSSIEKCKPCILEAFNEDEVLVFEMYAYLGAGVGYYKEFYANGNLKISGQYANYFDEDWHLKKGSEKKVNLKDGKWWYFDLNGDTSYYEIWDDGKFIKQEPGQDEAEIWKLELLLNGAEIKKDKVLSNKELKQLEIKPSYKNSSKSKNIIIRFGPEFKLRGTNQIYTLEEFKNSNLNSMIRKEEFFKGEGADFTFEVLDGKKVIETYKLKIRSNRSFFWYVGSCLF